MLFVCTITMLDSKIPIASGATIRMIFQNLVTIIKMQLCYKEIKYRGACI